MGRAELPDGRDPGAAARSALAATRRAARQRFTSSATPISSTNSGASIPMRSATRATGASCSRGDASDRRGRAPPLHRAGADLPSQEKRGRARHDRDGLLPEGAAGGPAGAVARLLLLAIYYLNPRAISPLGFNLMFNLAVPIALATIAQMCVITVNDLDLSIGAYVGFVVCVAATWLHDTPLLGIAALDRRHPRLHAGRRADPPPQPAVDRRHARHVLRLARACGAGPADAGRQVAGVARGADEAEAAV